MPNEKQLRSYFSCRRLDFADPDRFGDRVRKDDFNRDRVDELFAGATADKIYGVDGSFLRDESDPKRYRG